MILSFGLRDKTGNVVDMVKVLLESNNPYDLLEENSKNRSFLRRFEVINKKYQSILEKADKSIDGDILFYTYSGDMSISQYVANELVYKYPEKIIVVGYTKGSIVNLSLRWKGDIRTAVVNAISSIEGATGGGHEHASGARLPFENLKIFQENLLKEIEKSKKR
jgi:single-stranded DNA-specific DHH superfamily exonuclease